MRTPRKSRTVEFLVPNQGQACDLSYKDGRGMLKGLKGEAVVVSLHGTILFLEKDPIERKKPHTVFIMNDMVPGGRLTRWVIYINGQLRNVATVSWDDYYHHNIERGGYIRRALQGATRVA